MISLYIDTKTTASTLEIYVLIFCFCFRSTQIVQWSATLLVIALVTLARAQFHHPSQFRSQAVVNTGFIPSVQQESDDDDKVDDSTPSAAINYRQAYEYDEEEEEQRTVPNQVRRQQQFIGRPQVQTAQQQQQQSNRQQTTSKNRFEEELEPEEPDRLALALEKSTFQCQGRTGWVYVNAAQFKPFVTIWLCL